MYICKEKEGVSTLLQGLVLRHLKERVLIAENSFLNTRQTLQRKGTQDTPKITCHSFLLRRLQLLYFLPLENEEII